MLFSLLAATGLRIGEALALRSTDFGPDCRVLHVRRSVWRGQEQEPKTSNAVRVVDIPEILARELRDYVSTANGFLFATADGTTTAAAKCSADSPWREASGVSRLPALSTNVAQQRTACRKTSNDIGWATRPRRSGTCIPNSKTTFHFAKSGRNAPVWALSWYTLVHKTQLRIGKSKVA